MLAIVSGGVRGPTSLKISEIFASVQGEGISLGEPAVFLRLALCNLRCSWCDTKYTWDFKNYDYDQEVNEQEVSAVLEQLRSFKPRRLIVTGGEPLLQQLSLVRLLAALDPELIVEIETNGTLTPCSALVERVNQWNVAPKLDNCGEPRARRLREDVLTMFAQLDAAYLKIVVENPNEKDEVRRLVARLGWPKQRVVLMPQAGDFSLLKKRLPLVRALARKEGYRWSTRLHVELWQGARGK